MKTLVGRRAPSFTAQAVQGAKIIPDFSLDQYLNQKHVVFFFYPKDFTFVCPTELHSFEQNRQAFEERNVALVGCSTDTEYSHWAWLQMPKKQGGIEGVNYPIVADTNKTIAENFGVLAGDYAVDEEDNLQANGELVAYRGLFLIDKAGIVQHQVINNMPLGRSVQETLRMVDALQHFEQYGEVCPMDWHRGQQAMDPNHEGVSKYLASN
ncbi:MAG TPA: alkyl hydroperoxide reductase [Opitutae bacterium]|nr:alkyl hydroperoxide reductase [Opitutae bacterium]|tara:strand:- start:3947 stop:4576 length:630 start_codon:yes stop_codon:yes gene_type:complete